MPGGPGAGGDHVLSLEESERIGPKKVGKRKVVRVGKVGLGSLKHNVERPTSRSLAGTRHHHRFPSRSSGGQRDSGRKVGAFHSRVVRRGGYRQTRFSRDPPFLFFSALHGPKRPRPMETDNRSFQFKSNNSEKEFPHGGSQDYCKMYKPRSLGCEIGSKERLFSHPSCPRDLGIVQFCNKEERKTHRTLFLQKTSVRSDNGSLGVHKGFKTAQGDSQTTEHPNNFLPGRFPDLSPFARRGVGSYVEGHNSSARIRVRNKLEKDVSRTTNKARISGSNARPEKPDILASRKQSPEDSGVLQEGSEVFIAYKERPRKIGRILEFRSPISKIRKTVTKTGTKVDECLHVDISQGLSGSYKPCPQGRPAALGRSSVPSLSYSYKEKGGVLDPHDRCVRSSVVGYPSTAKGERKMARGVEEEFHELEGIDGNSFIPHDFPGQAKRPLRKNSLRQHNGSCLSTERGLLGFRGSVGPFSTDSDVCRFAQHLSSSSSHKREVKCPSRRSVEGFPHQHRMETGRSVLPEVLQSLGHSPDRFVRYAGKHEAPTVRVTMSRPQSGNMGCSEHKRELESVEISLPVSSVSLHGGNYWETEILQRGRIFDSPFLANQALVPSFVEAMSRQDSPPRRDVSIPGVFRNNCLPQNSFTFQASRLEVIKEAVLAEGLTAYSAYVLSRCHRSSTIKQYQGVWAKFLRFLTLENIRHHRIKIKDVINFLSFYSEVHTRAYKTLAVYKNALRLPLLFKLGLNIDTPLVYHYMKGLWAIIPPLAPSRMPKWDLNCLLIWLSSSEFFPPDKCNFYRLSQKTFFLMMLSSGRRLHEICALTKGFKEEGDLVKLFWPRWFRAKNHSLDHQPLDPSIRKLSHFKERRKELRNCPVLNWRVYLERRIGRQLDEDSCLWERDQRGMFLLFKTLILESQARAHLNMGIDIHAHHTKKLACSLCCKYWPDAKELHLEELTGNKRFGTLAKYYIKEVPELRVAVSLPFGTAPRV